MFFSKKAPKQKGGCLDTLDTSWIRHCTTDMQTDTIIKMLRFAIELAIKLKKLWPD